MPRFNPSPYFSESAAGLSVPYEAAQRYLSARNQQLPTVIYPEIRVIRAATPTQNKTFYPETSLRGEEDKGTGLISFIRPYPVPIIKDHNTGGSLVSESSEVYGRVFQPVQFHKADGVGFVRAMPAITHPYAIESILTGRWMTVSLGSRTESVCCSICGSELTEDDCEHEKGKIYETDDGEREALLVIGPIRAKEISFVLTPSDEGAGVLNPNLQESLGKRSTPDLSSSRIIIGDEKGVWDLSTGTRVEDSRLATRRPRFFNLRFPGSSPLPLEADPPRIGSRKLIPVIKEISMSDTNNPPIDEQFKGTGRYLLTGGWNHDHEVMLDGRGDGLSTPTSPLDEDDASDTDDVTGNGPYSGSYGEADNHTHEVVGGICRVSGDPPHTHCLEPAHAAMEMDASKSLDEGNREDAMPDDDLIVSLGDLYRLSSEDPEFDLSDDVDEAEGQEARLTYAARQKLPDSAFCGPDRSFPAHDASHTRNGFARLANSSLTPAQKASTRACLLKRAKRFGVDVSPGSGESALDDDNRIVSLGDLYRLPEDDTDFNTPDEVWKLDRQEARLTYAARQKLPDSAFCGPDRSFPAADAAHVRNGLARLPNSSLSPAQKASTRACLVRRAKRYGIKVSGEADLAHAARLVDRRHQVEIDLYPYPGNTEALTQVIEQIELMPHTEAEEDTILQRIAAHCRQSLSAAEWQTFFGNLDSIEEGDPVEIEITGENYALLYTALQNGLIGEAGAAAKPPASKATDVEDEPEASFSKGDTVKITDPHEPAHRNMTGTVVMVREGYYYALSLKGERVHKWYAQEELKTAPEESDCGCQEPSLDKPTPRLSAAEILTRVTVGGAAASNVKPSAEKSLPTTGTAGTSKLPVVVPETSQQKLAEALAHSVALYLRALRKPQARDKSLAELTQTLSTRTAESLQDTLDDLLLELESNPLPDIARLPQLESPVDMDKEPSPAETPSEIGRGSSIPTLITGSPVAESFKAAALDEEEEVIRLVGDLFGNIRMAVSPEEVGRLLD